MGATCPIFLTLIDLITQICRRWHSFITQQFFKQWAVSQASRKTHEAVALPCVLPGKLPSFSATSISRIFSLSISALSHSAQWFPSRYGHWSTTCAKREQLLCYLPNLLRKPLMLDLVLCKLSCCPVVSMDTNRYILKILAQRLPTLLSL